MQFQMSVVDACTVLAPFALLGVWIGICAGMIGIMQTVRRFSKPLRAAFLVVVLIFVNVSPAFAGIPMPGHCQWLNEMQFPCPFIEAMWCPCYWPSPPPPDGF